jgi:hypothetical protein
MKRLGFFLVSTVVGMTSCLASPLTLSCAGKVSSSNVPKNGVQSEVEVEEVKDFSVVVDPGRRVVSGFWNFENGVGNELPIVSESANNVTFKSHNRRVLDKSIEGTVDRITGKIDAQETQLFPSGSMTILIWDLRCKPARPLF